MFNIEWFNIVFVLHEQDEENGFRFVKGQCILEFASVELGDTVRDHTKDVRASHSFPSECEEEGDREIWIS